MNPNSDYLQELYNEVMGEPQKTALVNPPLSPTTKAIAPYHDDEYGQVNLPTWNGEPFEQEPDMSNTSEIPEVSTTPAVTTSSAPTSVKQPSTHASSVNPFFKFTTSYTTPKASTNKNFFNFEGGNMKGLGDMSDILSHLLIPLQAMTANKLQIGAPLTRTESAHVQTVANNINRKVQSGVPLTTAEKSAATLINSSPSSPVSTLTPSVVAANSPGMISTPENRSEGNGEGYENLRPRPLLLSGISKSKGLGDWGSVVTEGLTAVTSIFGKNQTSTSAPASTPATVVVQQPSSDISKPLIYVGIGLGVLIVGVIAYKAVA